MFIKRQVNGKYNIMRNAINPYNIVINGVYVTKSVIIKLFSFKKVLIPGFLYFGSSTSSPHAQVICMISVFKFVLSLSEFLRRTEKYFIQILKNQKYSDT